MIKQYAVAEFSMDLDLSKGHDFRSMRREHAQLMNIQY